MNKNRISVLGSVSMAVMMAAIPAAFAAASSSDFTSEPDKSMAAAHESFLKGDIQKASASFDKAAASVNKESEKVDASAKEGVKKAGDELEKLGQNVKSGAVKSDDELKKTFARVDNELAKGWHATAEERMKAGKDASNALKKAGESLSGAAKWVRHRTQERRAVIRERGQSDWRGRQGWRRRGEQSGSMTSATASRISNENFERVPSTIPKE